MPKFGRLPRRLDTLAASVPHLSSLKAMRTIQLPALQPEVHQAASLPEHLGPMKNDILGDCTIAALGHATQIWTADAQGAMVTIPDDDIEVMYEEAGGYQPSQQQPDGSNPTDNGANEQDVLTYASQTGIIMPDGSRSKLAAWVEIDPRQLTDVCEAIQECALVYIGFRVPSALNTDAGSVWGDDAGVDTGEGHAVICPGYSYRTEGPTFDVISWGDRFTMTPGFWRSWVDETYGLLSPLWIERTGKTPWGLDAATLEAIMQAIRGQPT